MASMLTRVILAGAAALGIASGCPSFAPRVAMAATEPPSDVSVQPSPVAWQQQWDLLLRQEDQLRHDERQVQEIAPRLQPNVVDELQQGLALTRQRLAQRRQQLLAQQPPAIVAPDIPLEPAAGSLMRPRSAVVTRQGS